MQAPGCVYVSKAFDVIRGWLGLLSGFWKLSYTDGSRSGNGVGEAQQRHSGCCKAFEQGRILRATWCLNKAGQKGS